MTIFLLRDYHMSELFEGYEGDTLDAQQLKQDNINHKLTSIGSLEAFTAAMAATPVDRKQRTKMMRDPTIPARHMYYRKPSTKHKEQVRSSIDWLLLHADELPPELNMEKNCAPRGVVARDITVNVGSVESREADAAIQDASREDASVGLFYMEGISAYKGRTAAFFEALRNPNLRGDMHRRGLSDAQVQLYLGEVQAEAYRKYAEHKAYMLRWRGMQEFRGVTRAIEEEAKGVKLSKAQSNAKDMPSQERLNELLSYDPETGTLVRAIAQRGVTKGSVAYTVRKDGKLKTRADGGLFATARVVYMLVTGIDPKEATIHCINGDLSDLRWDNLMLETTSNAVSSTGVTDKERLNYDTKYRARVKISGRETVVGDFDTEEEAEAAKSLFIKTLKRSDTPSVP
jgi:hypothetical protein